MVKKSISSMFVLFLVMAGIAFGQTVDDIVKKSIEARGGYDKIKSINTYKMTGKVMAQGMEMPIIMIKKRPNLTRMDISMQGQTMVQAYDGETAWMINPFMGDPTPQTMPETQAKSMKEDADFDGQLVDYKKKGHKVELMGKEDMEGTEVYKLKLSLKNGDIQYIYLDSEYYLPLKSTAKIKRGEAEIESVSYLSDYKDVSGLMIPFSIEQKMNGNIAAQITIEKVETNVAVPDSLFKMPEKK